MGCFGKSAAWMCVAEPPRGRNIPEKRTEASVRFNTLPNGAQGLRPRPAQPARRHKAQERSAQMGAGRGFSQENAYLCHVSSPARRAATNGRAFLF